jgi:hypothetical protein
MNDTTNRALPEVIKGGLDSNPIIKVAASVVHSVAISTTGIMYTVSCTMFCLTISGEQTLKHGQSLTLLLQGGLMLAL